MNRIKIGPLATTSPKQKSKGQLANGLPHLQQPTHSEHSLFVPLHYEKAYAYPLIVWLHSDGDDIGQLKRIMPNLSVRNYVAVAPQAPVGNPNQGFMWQQSAMCIGQVHQAVATAIDDAQLRTNIASERIFLAGYGGGGTMAFRIAFERPDIFAGVASINGPLPDGQTPLRQWCHCRNLPIFWAHGRHSLQFDQDVLCHQLRLLHIAGFSLTLRQYPIGDALSQRTLVDLNRWIMEMIDTAVAS